MRVCIFLSKGCTASAKFGINMLLLCFVGKDCHLLCFEGRAYLSKIRRVLSRKRRRQPRVKCLNLEYDGDLRQTCFQHQPVISIDVLSRLLTQTWRYWPMRGQYYLLCGQPWLKVAVCDYLLHIPHWLVFFCCCCWFVWFFFFFAVIIFYYQHKKKRKYNIPPGWMFLQCFQLEIQALCLKG